MTEEPTRYWKIVDEKWMAAKEEDFPSWDEDAESWEGFHLEDYVDGLWNLYVGDGRWIIEWGSEIHFVLIDHPRDVIDILFKLKVSSLFDAVSSSYILADTVAEILARMPFARRAVASREEQRRKRLAERRQSGDRAGGHPEVAGAPRGSDD